MPVPACAADSLRCRALPDGNLATCPSFMGLQAWELACQARGEGVAVAGAVDGAQGAA